MTGEPAYGQGDASFQAAGGEAGVRQLVEAFYRVMASEPWAARILAMHPRDLEVSIDKLSRFLCGWLGGPKLYREKYGSIAIPPAHAHLPIVDEYREAWLSGMRAALAEQPYAEDFKTYMITQLNVPASRIVALRQNIEKSEAPRSE